MVAITASLFAHIENDAHITGTFGLEGNFFSNTVGYLRQYLSHLKSKGEVFPEEYASLLQNMDYLISIQQQLFRSISPPDTRINHISSQITTDLLKLDEGKKIHIPGGWCNINGGHAMVYELTRTREGFTFTAVNAGGGIENHHKKSGTDKELYNPLKTWSFPCPEHGSREEEELKLFIKRILKPRLPFDDQTSVVTSEVLYNKILPTISHLGGREIETPIPDYGYTGGQLSGTCSQRCIHQMLKLLSPSAKFYERFIFKFKHFALLDYSKECLSGKLPLTLAVKDQINLAIENNLKILNTPNLFKKSEKSSYYNELKLLQKTLNTAPILATNTLWPSNTPEARMMLRDSNTTLNKPYSSLPRYNVEQALEINLGRGGNLLQNLTTLVRDINNIKNPATRYVYLEKLILSLPLNKTDGLSSPFYNELTKLEDYQQFAEQLNKIQELIHNLQNEWLKKAQIPSLNHLAVNLIVLQTDTHFEVTKKQHLPSFNSFTDPAIQSIIGNCARNPFWGSNNPKLDQRFNKLQERFRWSSSKSKESFYSYLNSLLAKESTLKSKLEELYREKFGLEVTEVHKAIRANQLEALFMISQHPNKTVLGPEFTKIITIVRNHLDYEFTLGKAINPFYTVNFAPDPRSKLKLEISDDNFWVQTPLYPAYVHHQKLTEELLKNKYELKDSPAKDALKNDSSNQTSYAGKIIPRSANSIQLRQAKPPEKADALIPVTQADIIARDYFHLRSVPSLQIPLTLDYFTRHINKLANESDQRYVEANLFQPGLLQEAQKEPSFLPQFTTFLSTGYRFFNKDGQFTRESTLFLRLDYLVSRYMSADKDNGLNGLLRLRNLQEQLLKQLSQPSTPDIAYIQQQYLFLTLMARIELGDNSKELFALAFSTYFYIQSHANPNILEDLAHHVEVDRAITNFQILASKQSKQIITQAVESWLANSPNTDKLKITSDLYPIYTLEEGSHSVEMNVHLGRVFEKKLARSGVPFTIQKDPLIKRLGLAHFYECLSSGDEQYMLLSDENIKASLFLNNNNLTVQKYWTVQDRKSNYELRALSKDHLAFHANKSAPVTTTLPKVLTDESSDYWHSTSASNEGLLTQNNQPAYSYTGGKFKVLDKNGRETAYMLEPIPAKWSAILNSFENSKFILAHVSSSDTVFKLPRYNLEFQVDNKGELVHPEADEKVITGPSPIHPSVAGLMLANDRQTRLLVPVTRFYATEHLAQESDYYPVIHDKDGTVAAACLEEEWKFRPPAQVPLWSYTNSERAISFRLIDGEPTADSVADSLYLAYIYLSTNQPEKAWKILEDCNTRLGGLTGDPAELQFISWICNDVPHILPTGKKKAKREAPPYVACQLKVMSLLGDYLLQDRKFNLVPPISGNTANVQYQQIQYGKLTQFLSTLPKKIYNSFERMQTMQRHVEHSYKLSLIERKRLLDYYHQSLPENTAPLGALGYEKMCITLEFLQQEQEALQARNKSGKLSSADSRRLEFIDKSLSKLQPVVAKSTILEPIPIDLTLAADSKLKEKNKTRAETWINKLPGTQIVPDAAMNALSSDMSEDDFISYFPAYFQVAYSGQNRNKQQLRDFCTKTLIANRHVPLSKQESDIPLLCNILYRILNDNSLVTDFRRNEIKFDEIVKKLSTTRVTPITILQAKDIYSSILARPEEILAQKRPSHIPLVSTKSLDPSLIVQKEIEKKLGEGNDSLSNLVQQYREVETKTTKEIEELGKTLTHDLNQRFSVEVEAGKKLFAQEQQQKALAQTFIDNPMFANLILDAARKIAPSLADQTQSAWAKALEFANQGPTSEKEKIAWKIEKRAKSRAKLTKADLLSIYCHADVAYSIEKTKLSAENAQELHNLIHEALFNGIQNQLAEKIVSNLEKALVTKDVNTALQALELLTREEIPGLDEPATVLIQHEENILLRKRQVSAIKNLLTPLGDGSTNETVEKVIPGGGKSKVIIPILAEKKALGDNLVVVEVPSESLPTNHVDFNRTSQRLYGKRAYRFEFDRDSNISPKRLEQLYHHFTEIMTTRCYLVTTGESIQSLELKYLELLLGDIEHNETWKKQVFWLDKINDLFHNNADCIIDEAHRGLWLKRKLNYTFGVPKPISPELIKNAIGLYNFIDVDFIKQAPSFDIDYDWTSFKTTLATKLIKESTSPLKAFVDKSTFHYGQDIQEKLIAYLLDKEMCEAVTHATAEEKAALSFFKQEITTILPETLRHNLNENYGPSKLKNLSPAEYTLAIPYAGNNTPSERSRDGNEFVAINRTIQMMLIKGISKEHFKARVQTWQALARQELFLNPTLRHLDETPTARGFALLNAGFGLTLSKIDLDNTIEMDTLYQRHKNNRSLISSLLQDESLKQINLDAAILSSDSFNHVDLYHSVQALTGTPGNHPTFHHRLKFNATPSLGSDGYILETLNAKKTPISSSDYQGVASFIKNIIDNAAVKKRTRAVIDINATFTGVSNLTVAKELASYIKQNPNQFSHSIKHVLYFNEEQILCALEVNNPEKTHILGTSDEKEISLLLGSKPNERFTYYDQPHTLGTDIQQAEDAHALVLIDENNSFQDYIQGDMRMRWLSQGHSIELIVPKRLGSITRPDLTQRLVLNENTMLLGDILFAGLGQLTNYMRRSSLSQIQDLPSEDAEAKSMIAKHFRCFFEDRPSHNYFAMYGGLSENQDVSAMLEQSKNQLLDTLKDCFKSMELEIPEEILKTITTDLKTIIDAVLPWCPKKHRGQSTQNKEVQVQNQIQKEIQIQRIQENACYNPTWHEATEKIWTYVRLPDFFKNEQLLKEMTIGLNQLCANDGSLPSLFSTKLRASRNYAQTYTHQDKYLNVFLKPVFLVWYHYENDALQATIVTPQELESLEAKVKSATRSWIATTQDVVVAGTRPKESLTDENYFSLREQVRFFNGEFQSLLNQDTPLRWLKEQPLEKINFFENQLLAFRPGSETELPPLKAALSQANIEGFNYITAHPFEDLSQYDWTLRYPNIIPAQAAEYKKVAEAFVYLNQNWFEKNLTVTDVPAIQSRFGLPLSSLDYVNDHLKHLCTIRELLTHLASNGLVPPGSEEGEKCLQTCLGMSLGSFYKNHNIEDPENETLEQTEFPLVQILPALRDKQQALPVVMVNGHAVSKQLGAIKALQAMQNYPALKDKSLTSYFLKVAEKAIVPEVLYELIRSNEKNLSDPLLSAILSNPICDDLIIKDLLGSPSNFSEPVLELLAQRCNSTEVINKLFTKPNLDDTAFCILLGQKQDYLKEEHLSSILKNTKDPYTLELIYEYYSSNKTIVESLCKHPLLPSNLMITLMKKGLLTEDNLLLILNKRTDIKADALQEITKITGNEKILLAAIKHKNADSKVMQHACDSKSFSLTIAKEILNLKKDHIAPTLIIELLTKLVNNAFEQYNSTELPDWQNFLLEVLERYKNPPQKAPLIKIVGCQQLKPKFALKILRTLGAEAASSLPIKDMIKEAEDIDLLLILTIKQIGVLSEGLLLDIAIGCKNLHIITNLLKRSDITVKILNQILHRTDIDTGTLLEVVAHPQADSITKGLAISHRAFSAEGAKEIITKTKLFDEFLRVINQNHLLFTELTKVAFSKISTVEKSEWEKVLLQIFKKYQISPSSSHLESSTLINLIGLNSVDASFGLKILAVFGKAAIKSLPLQDMIDSAKIEDIPLLTEMVNGMPTKQAIALANRCQSPELMTSFLKNELDDETLRAVLLSKDLNPVQLIRIATKVKNVDTLKMVFHHKQTNNLVRRTIYNHVLFSDNLILELLTQKACGLSNDNILEILQEKNKLSITVLTAILNKSDLNSQVCSALILHPKIKIDVKVKAVQHEALLPEDANKIVTKSNLVDGYKVLSSEQHTILKEIIKKALAKATTNGDLWNPVLVNVIGTYQWASKFPSVKKAYEEILEIIKNQQINVDLGFKILEVLGSDILRNLPIAKMIELAKDKELDLLLKTEGFSSDELLVLATRCKENGLLIRFLARKDIKVEILEKLLQEDLNPGSLLAIIRHSKANTSIKRLAINHQKFDHEHAKELQLQRTQSHQLLMDLAEKCLKTKGERWKNLLVEIVKQSLETQETQEIKELEDIIFKKQISPSLGIQLLSLLRDRCLYRLPLSSMIDIADDDALSLIINLDTEKKLADKLLIKLVQKTKSQSTIEALLKRDNISSAVLLEVLNSIPSYENLNRALSHANLPATERNNWLENLRVTQTLFFETAISENNAQKKLLAALDALKVKACSHAIKALSDKNYTEVAQTSIELYRNLRQEVHQYLNNPNNPDAFVRNCDRFIGGARAILETHRGGFKQHVADFFNAILAILTVKFLRSEANKFSFFETKTDSMKIVENLAHNIQSYSNKNSGSKMPNNVSGDVSHQRQRTSNFGPPSAIKRRGRQEENVKPPYSKNNNHHLKMFDKNSKELKYSQVEGIKYTK